VDADAVAETVQGNYMSFLPLLPEVPGGGRHDWEAQAPLPVQQAWRCPAPWPCPTQQMSVLAFIHTCQTLGARIAELSGAADMVPCGLTSKGALQSPLLCAYVMARPSVKCYLLVGSGHVSERYVDVCRNTRNCIPWSALWCACVLVYANCGCGMLMSTKMS
jgi:hypothetical protein